MAVVADQVVWFSPQVREAALMDRSLSTCLGFILAAALVLSLLRMAFAEQEALRARPEAASPASLAVAVATVAWVLAACAQVWRPRTRLQEVKDIRQDVAQCQSDLHAWYLAEQAHRSETGSYDARYEAIHLLPPFGNHYAYFASPEGPLATQVGKLPNRPEGATGSQAKVYGHRPDSAVERSEVPRILAGGAKLGVEGTCPQCEATAVCAGHPYDGELDLWSVSTRDRELPDGRVVRAGVSYHEQDGAHLE
jgi:hypothetical protein